MAKQAILFFFGLFFEILPAGSQLESVFSERALFMCLCVTAREAQLLLPMNRSTAHCRARGEPSQRPRVDPTGV